MTSQPLDPAAAADNDCGAMTARDLLHSVGVLLVTRPPRAAPRPPPGQPGAASDYVASWSDVFLAVLDDGRILALNGHVDLGTGVRTALAQIVAEELDVDLDRVRMILGHTDAAPNQGPTIASTTIQVTATPLRRAAAQARAFLLEHAAQRLGLDVAELSVRDGTILHNGTPRIHYTDLVRGGYVELVLRDDVACKPPHSYRVVGRDVPRVDIPAKATGKAVYVHDVRLPGMLHGRVVRPPYAGRDCGEFVGTSLRDVDDRAAAALPGYVATVIIGDFVGVVAAREEIAERAARLLRLTWDPPPSLPDLRNGAGLAAALRAIPARRRPLSQAGDADAALAGCPRPLRRTYVWPYQMHASIGPSCAVADFGDDGLTVWSGTQNPHVHRLDLACLLDLDEGRIRVLRHEAAGCYGRNGADDAGADAALLSRAVGRPVRVQLSRDQEHAWEPKGAAQLVDVDGGLDKDGGLAAYDFLTRYPSNDAPTLALLLTGKLASGPRQLEMGDRTAVPPYDYPNVRVACDDVPAIVRAAWLRGVSALPNAFAHECYIDELAQLAGEDPLAFRLRHLPDVRARELLQALARQAGWSPRHGARRRASADGRMCYGQGIAYARYVHSRFPGFGAAWSAWIADVEVDCLTGAVRVARVVVGQDTGMMVNPAGVRHQVHGNVIQTVSRTLKEEVAFDERGVASREWGAYPILRFDEVPAIEVLLMPRQDEPPLGAGESASVPGAAAIANALFDATGVRYTAPPFTPATIRAGMREGMAAACP
jgi:CO/xanthine dehydrogenase Mo-binding subunit